jgi:hypothetical protein
MFRTFHVGAVSQIARNIRKCLKSEAKHHWQALI